MNPGGAAPASTVEAHEVPDRAAAVSAEPGTRPAGLGVAARLGDHDWKDVERGLWERGYAKTRAVVSADECDALVNLYPHDTKFRSRVEMARYRFGRGEYKYFANPLPSLVQEIRSEAYRRLVPTANLWVEALGFPRCYPPELSTFLEVCARHGQVKPGPLLLQYGEGDYNCLHQDVLGEVAFPFQAACCLSRRDVDYHGGEFLLVEQPWREQPRAEVVVLEQGELLIFTTDRRPAATRRGYRPARVRHGVSRVTSGRRYSLGVLFHDSK